MAMNLDIFKRYHRPKRKGKASYRNLIHHPRPKHALRLADGKWRMQRGTLVWYADEPQV